MTRAGKYNTLHGGVCYFTTYEGKTPVTVSGDITYAKEGCSCSGGYTYNSNTAHCDAPCTSCGYGLMESSPCTSTSDRTCTLMPGYYYAYGSTVAQCTTCGYGQAQVSACSTYSNTQCRTCLICSAGNYLSVACSASTSGTCTVCSTCPVSQYSSVDCGGSSDTTCGYCNTLKYTSRSDFEVITGPTAADSYVQLDVGCGRGAGLLLSLTSVLLSGTPTTTSKCYTGASYRSQGGWSVSLQNTIPATGACYDCWKFSTALSVPFAIAPQYDRDQQVMNYQCVPGLVPVVATSIAAVTTTATGAIPDSDSWSVADCWSVLRDINTLCSSITSGTNATAGFCSIVRSSAGACYYQSYPVYPLPNATSISVITQPAIFGDDDHLVVQKKCYAGGGDATYLDDSVNNGQVPISCGCRGITGSHNCTMSDSTSEVWSADGATSFTRFNYASSGWVFDPTSYENRGSVIVSAQPYARKLNGDVIGFYLDIVNSQMLTGKVVYTSDDDTLQMTMLVRQKPASGQTSGATIIVDSDTEHWYGASAALDDKNPDHAGAFAVTQYTDAFYFDIRFHKKGDLTTGAKKVLYQAAGRTVGTLLEDDYPPAVGVRFESMYRKCDEPGTYQIGDTCIDCAATTCSAIKYQTARPDGSSGCQACKCGGGDLDPNLDPDASCYSCTKTCACIVQPAWCSINNECHMRFDQRSPSEGCLQCRPELTQSVWSALSDPNITCDDDDICTAGDSCQEGICRGDRLQCLSFEQTGDVTQACELCAGNAGCIQDPIYAGCVYTNETDGNRTCGCSIDEDDGNGPTCYPHGTIDPNNTCQMCDVQLDSRGWSFRPPVDCDDGDACTYGDSCSAGTCVGFSYTCSAKDAPCVEKAVCNGRGTCDFVYRPTTTLCQGGDGVCQADRFCDGKHGFCPPSPAIIPIITGGDVAVTLSDGRAPSSLADNGSPYLSTMFIAVSNWSVACGGLNFSIGWYADPDGTLGCSDITVQSTSGKVQYGSHAFSSWQPGNGIPARADALLQRSQSMNGTVATDPSAGVFALNISMPLLTRQLTAVDASGTDADTNTSTSNDTSTTSSTDTTTSHNVSFLPLPGPTWITAVVKSMNVRGREYAACIGPIAVDDSPPVPSAIRNLNPAIPDDGYSSFSSHASPYLSFTWLPFEESPYSSWGGLLRYQYAIGTQPELDDVYRWKYAGLGVGSATTISELAPLPNGVPLYITVRGNNRAGLFADSFLGPLLVDPTPAFGCAVFDGFMSTGSDVNASTSVPVQQTYTSDNDAPLQLQLTGCRDPESGIASLTYCWGTVPGDCDVTPPQQYNAFGVHSLQTLKLSASIDSRVPGFKYYAFIRIVSGSGAATTITSSGGILDITPPTSFTVDLPQYWPSNTSIRATWSYDEPESAVYGPAYVWIGSRQGVADIVPKMEVTGPGVASGATIAIPSSKTLVHGSTYYLCVYLLNAVSLRSESSCASTTIDVTPATPVEALPVHPSNIQGPAIVALDIGTVGLAARWQPSSEDISGIVGYSARLTTNGAPRTAKDLVPAAGPGPVPLTPWTDVQGTMVTLRPVSGSALKPGSTVWITVRVTNGAGVVVESTSAGVFVGNGTVSTGPVIVAVSQYPDRPSSWWGFNDVLTFSFPTIIDAYAGIGDYQYAIGTCTHDTVASVVPWTSVGHNNGSTSLTVGGLALTIAQPYCVSVSATSNSGLMASNTSAPFYIDPTPPTLATNSSILDVAAVWTGAAKQVSLPTPSVEIDYSVSFFPSSTPGVNGTALLGASWASFADDSSGILAYWACAGMARGQCDLLPPTDLGMRQRWNVSVQADVLGKRVYISVCGLNAAGLCTNVSSDGVLFDNTAPIAGRILFPDSSTTVPAVVPNGTGSIIIPLYFTQPSSSPIRIQLKNFTTSGAPISRFLVDVGSSVGASNYVAAKNYSTSTEIQLAVATLSPLSDGAPYCVSVTAVSLNGLQTRYAPATCAVYDGSQPPTFSLAVATRVSQAHMKSWPRRDFVTVCASGIGDAHSGIITTVAVVGFTAFGEQVVPNGPATIASASNRLPVSPVAACFNITGISMQPNVPWSITVTQTNGAGLARSATTPTFYVDDTAPAALDVLLPSSGLASSASASSDASWQPGSVYLPGSITGSFMPLYFSPSVDSESASAGGGSADGLEYWAALGSAPGQANRWLWRPLVNVTAAEVNGPAGPLQMLRGFLPINATVGYPAGRSYVSVMAINAVGRTLIAGSAQLAAPPTAGATIAVAPGAMLVDRSPPEFPAQPVLSSGGGIIGADGLPVHSNGTSDVTSITVVWKHATTNASSIAFYRVCILRKGLPGNASLIRPAETMSDGDSNCMFAGLRTRVVVMNLALHEGAKYIAVVEAVSSSNVTASISSMPIVIDTIAPVIGSVRILRSITDSYAAIPAFIAPSPVGVAGGIDGITGIVYSDVAIAWSGAADNANGTGILSFEAALGTALGATDLAFYQTVQLNRTLNVNGTLISFATVHNVRLSHGVAVFVALRVKDAAGNTAVQQGDFAVKAVTRGPNPTGFALSLPNGTFQTASNSLNVRIAHPGGMSVSDLLAVTQTDISHAVVPTGISSYRLCIAQASNDTSCTAPAPGGGWRDISPVDSYIFTSLTLLDGYSYYPIVMAVGNSGLSISALGPRVTIDMSPPVAGSITIPVYTSSNTTLQVSWDAFDDGAAGSGVDSYSVQIINVTTFYSTIVTPIASNATRNATGNVTAGNVTAGNVTSGNGTANNVTIISWTTGVAVTGWINVGGSTFALVPIASVTVRTGSRIGAALKACDKVGLCTITNTTYSNAASVDLSPPIAGARISIVSSPSGSVASPSTFIKSYDTVSAAWDAWVDADSGISQYLVAVGLNPGGQQISAFQAIGTATRYTWTGLPLEPGSNIYVTVQGVNNGGLATSASSPSSLVSPIQPVPFKVYDGALIDVVVEQPREAAALGVVPGLRLDCTNKTVGKLAPIINCTNRTVSVVAAAPRGSAAYYDFEPLVAGQPSMDAQFYHSPFQRVGCHWTASADPVAGITSYIVTIGYLPGSGEVVPATRVPPSNRSYTAKFGSSLRPGPIWCSVTAVSGSGLVRTVFSDSAIVDRTPPFMSGYPRLLPLPGMAASTYQRDPTQLFVSWAGVITEPESGIAYAEVAAVRRGGAAHSDAMSNGQVLQPDGAPWLRVGPGVFSTLLANLTLSSGSSYLAILRARNIAGDMSAIAISTSAITVDSLGPQPTTFISNVAASVIAMQNGRASAGLPKYGYLADPSLPTSLQSRIDGSAPGIRVPTSPAWTPVITANQPWGSVGVHSLDSITCSYNNRPSEVNVIALLPNNVETFVTAGADPYAGTGTTLSAAWAAKASSMVQSGAGVTHGSLCADGFFRSLFGTCAPCAPGTWKSGVSDATSCGPCGANTWWSVRHSQTGYGSLARSFTTTDRNKQLSGGVTADNGAACACLDHVTQVFNPAANGACVCKAGFYLKSGLAAPDLTNDPEPPTMPDGVVSTVEDGWCTKCPANTYKASIGNDYSACIKCPAGTAANSEGTACDCIDGSMQHDGNQCACAPGFFLQDGVCIQCIGRMTYKDLAGNSKSMCKRCPFGTEPTDDKTACQSNVPGMVYNHKVGAAYGDNKGYCPAGTTHSFSGMRDEYTPGLAFGIMDLLHNFPDWYRMDHTGSGYLKCYELKEDWDTGDYYFDVDGYRMWESDAIDGDLFVTRQVSTWDFGTELKDGYSLPTPPPFDGSMRPSYPVNDEPYLGTLTDVYPRHRHSHMFDFVKNYYWASDTRLNAASEQEFYILVDEALDAWRSATSAVSSFLNKFLGGMFGGVSSAVSRAVSQQSWNNLPGFVRDPKQYITTRRMASWEYDAFMRDWVDSIDDLDADGRKEKLQAFKDDARTRIQQYLKIIEGQWMYSGGVASFNLLTKRGSFAQNVQDILRMQWANLVANVSSLMSRPDNSTLSLNELLYLIKRGPDAYLAARLGTLWYSMDNSVYAPFDGDLDLASFDPVQLWMGQGFFGFFKSDLAKDYDASRNNGNVRRQINGQQVTGSDAWQRWAGALDNIYTGAKQGSYKFFPAALGTDWAPAAGQGVYRLTRTQSRCTQRRSVPVHSCIPCSGGTFQPRPIPLETSYWNDKRWSEGTCFSCPASDPSRRANPTDLGAINYFLVANLTRLYLDWTGVFAPDDLSGLASYQYALGSSVGGTQYQAFTAAKPPRRTTLEIGIDRYSIMRLGLQPGAPIFLSIMAIDNVGNAAVYSDPNPVVWDPLGPVPGDSRDANLDDYVPLNFDWSSLAQQGNGSSSNSSSTLRLLQEVLSTPVAATRHGARDTKARAASKPASSSSRREALRSLSRSLQPEAQQPAATRVDGSEHASIATHPNTFASSSLKVKARRLQYGTWSGSGTYDWRTDASLQDITYVADLDFQTSTTTLSVTYEAFGSLASGVAGLSYCAGTQPYACDIYPATLLDGVSGDVPTAYSITISGLNLAVPSVAYVTVSAASGSGLFATVTTDGIRIDNRPPSSSLAQVFDTGRYAAEPSSVRGSGAALDAVGPALDINCDASLAGVGAAWSGFNAPLGLLRYNWCVGSSPGQCDILPWTDVGVATSVYNATLLIPEGAVVFSSAQIVDRAGQTAMATSDGVRMFAPSVLAAALDTSAADNTTSALVAFNSSASSNSTNSTDGLDTSVDPGDGLGSNTLKYLCSGAPIDEIGVLRRTGGVPAAFGSYGVPSSSTSGPLVGFDTVWNYS